jgi:sugar (pentulose or hexulose) kinase
MDDFDFIKAFANVSIIEVEVVGDVVGRALGAAFKGMVAAGLSRDDANMVVRSVVRELFAAVMKAPS